MSEIFTKAGKNFYALMLANKLTKGMISALCSRYSRLNNQRWTMSAKLGPAEYDRHVAEVVALMEHVESYRPLCTEEHTKSGIAYLRALLWTPAGNQRKTKHADQFEPADTQVLAGARQIALVGFDTRACGHGIDDTRPIYEVRDSTLRRFCYVMSPWQAGGHFEILTHA